MLTDDDNAYDVEESTVTTLAERLYECGHSPDEAIGIAWGFAEFLYELGVI